MSRLSSAIACTVLASVLMLAGCATPTAVSAPTVRPSTATAVALTPAPATTPTLPSGTAATPRPTAPPAPTTTRPAATPTRDPSAAIITGRVIDQPAAQPIAGAIVYYGANGSLRTRTGQDGAYGLDVPWGDLTLTAYAKGYARRTETLKVGQGERRELNFALTPSETHVRQADLTGSVALVVTAAGSRSESRWYELHPTDGSAVVLFDEIGLSTAEAFDRWNGSPVRVRGYYETGFVGWSYRQTPGVYVEEIVGAP